MGEPEYYFRMELDYELVTKDNSLVPWNLLPEGQTIALNEDQCDGDTGSNLR